MKKKLLSSALALTLACTATAGELPKQANTGPNYEVCEVCLIKQPPIPIFPLSLLKKKKCLEVSGDGQEVDLGDSKTP